MTDIASLEPLARLGAYGLLLLFVVLLYRGEVLWGRELKRQQEEAEKRYQDMKSALTNHYDEVVALHKARNEMTLAQLEEWRTLALNGTLLARQVVDLAQKDRP